MCNLTETNKIKFALKFLLFEFLLSEKVDKMLQINHFLRNITHWGLLRVKHNNTNKIQEFIQSKIDAI